jgi:hypothetical protein
LLIRQADEGVVVVVVNDAALVLVRWRRAKGFHGLACLP